MKNKIIFHKLIFSLIILSFFISRLYLLLNPPYKKGQGYSDAKHYYERYANIWYYGLPPYLKHYFEYPPATIPLILTPLIIDQKGIGKYYPNYRIQILIIDILLFWLIYKSLVRLKVNKGQKWLSLVFYILASFLTKAYLYEGIDLPFITALIASFVVFLFSSGKSLIARFLFWSFFWLSTAIKFLTLPLIIPLFYLIKKSFKKELIILFLGFLSVWGLPLIIFRSSLSVSFVYHLGRSMKYSSFPYFISDTINLFSKTEIKSWEPPDMPLIGPVSTQVKQIFDVIFIGSIILMVILSALSLAKKNKTKTNQFEVFQYMLKTSLIFIFILLTTGKILSAPFHIWYIPFIALFPFKKIKDQLFFMVTALFSIIISTIGLLDVKNNFVIIEPFKFVFFMTCLRFLPIFIMLYLSIKLPINKRTN